MIDVADVERTDHSLLAVQLATARHAMRRSVVEFLRDDGFDEAAALTYYSLLSVLPAVLVAVALLGVVGQGESATSAILRFIHELLPKDVADVISEPVQDFTSRSGAGLLLTVALVGAIWFASYYVHAFTRALNRMYQVEEGRPLWKLTLFGYVLTGVLVVLLAVATFLLVVSGRIAQALLRALEIQESWAALWEIAKWPVLLALVITAVALLYHATPNVVPRRFHWLSPGAVFALVVGGGATLGFALFLLGFGSFNYYYGALTGVLLFFVWLYTINAALLFGARINAELERGRQLEEGLPAERALHLRPRSTRTSRKRAARYRTLLDRATALRMTGGATDDPRAASHWDDAVRGPSNWV